MVRAIERIRERRAAHRRADEQLDRRATRLDTHRLHDMVAFDVDRRVGASKGCASPTRASTSSCSPRLNVLASEAVFLDDLGINLKPAREMGMTTIKVTRSRRRARRARPILGFEVHCMELLWVRHGEPERIAPGTRRAGRPATHRRGREQAQRLADWLALSSRSTRSCRARSGARSRPRRRSRPRTASRCEIVDGLIEYDSQSDHYIPMEELARERRPPLARDGRGPLGGASAASPPSVFRARVAATVDELVSATPGQRVVAVCHGGVDQRRTRARARARPALCGSTRSTRRCRDAS